jgi:hypothetical protein
MMFESDSVGGAEARRKGFSNFKPVNVVDKFAMGVSFSGREECTTSEGWGRKAKGGRLPLD